MPGLNLSPFLPLSIQVQNNEHLETFNSREVGIINVNHSLFDKDTLEQDNIHPVGIEIDDQI